MTKAGDVIQIDPKSNLPIYRQIMDQLRRQVLTGNLAAGDQVESVSKLSDRLAVNPMTVSKAYGQLVDQGVLERRRGVGIFVSAMTPAVAREQQKDMLARALAEAASLAVQMGFPRREIHDLLNDQLDRLTTKQEKKR